MKTPAVAVTAAFAGGIVLGGTRMVAAHAGRHWFLTMLCMSTCVLVCAGVLLAKRNVLWLAVSCSLLSWIGLGMLASCLTQQPLPADHILSRVAAQQVPLRTPLRWMGTLRSEPSRMPWGWGLDVVLARVEMAEGTLPVSGGMRIGYAPREGDPRLPELHAGDEVTIFAEGRLPQVFRDPGAFDRRAFLAGEDIHLVH